MVVHQTLHGYDEGHRLLSTSMPLGTEEQHRIALLSDISGHAAGVRFDSYLTGYPVRAGLYALARTWAAPEVPRAGSVWTHTLLLDDDAIDAVHDVGPLLALLRRPDSDGALPYSTPLELAELVVADDRQPPPEVAAELSRAVVRRLYDPTTPMAVRVVSEATPSIEAFVLALWTQQWPALRMTFSFCTLALGALRLDRDPFMLQVTPPAHAAPLAADEQVAVIDVAAPGDGPPADAWATGIADDLMATGASRPWRQFVRRYGPDLPSRREQLARLAGVFAVLDASVNEASDVAPSRFSREGVRRAMQLVSLVGGQFPLVDRGLRLKAALFGGTAAVDPWPTGVSEAETLLALSVTKRSTALDANALAVADRAGRLLDTDRDAATRLARAALEIGANAIGQQVLAPLTSGGDGDVLPSAVARDVALATRPALWTTTPDARRSMWETIASLEIETIDVSTREQIVGAIIEAGGTELSESVVEHFGDAAVRALLVWLGRPGTDVEPAWRQTLARRPAALLDALAAVTTLEARSLSACADVLDPDHAGVRDRPIDSWLDIATRAAKVTPDPVDFKAFLLALALDQQGPEAASIGVLTFQAVYDAARDQKLSPSAWAALQSRVPRIMRQWDHCERLRRGIAVRFARGDWPMTYLPQVVRGELTLDLLLGHCLETEAGRRFVLRVVKGVPRPLRWGASQRAVVQRFVAKAAVQRRMTPAHE